jgi:hypothetical protein
VPVFAVAWMGHRLWPELDTLVRIKRGVKRLFRERRSKYAAQGN